MRLSIGELARRTGVKVVTIRWYEGQEVISPCERSPAGTRYFDEAALRRLLFIRRSRDLGFSLEEVRDLLRIGDAAPRSPGLAEQARRHLARVDGNAASLAALREVLQALARGDPGQSPAGLVSALADDPVTTSN